MRRFGNIRKVKKYGNDYLEASYPTPVEAAQENPLLPARITKTVRAAYRADLEVWLAQAEKDIKNGIWEPPLRFKKKNIISATITFKEYAEQYVIEHRKADGSMLAPTTIARHKEWLHRDLYPTFGSRDMRAIKPYDIQQWWENFGVDKAGNGRSQRYNIYTFLSSIFKHAAEAPLDDTGRTLIVSSPCMIKAVKPRKKHESMVADYDELKILAAHMPDYLAISIYLAGVCGLREGEVCALTRKDIDFDYQRVNVDKSVKQINEIGQKRKLIVGAPKSVNSIRKVPYPEWLESILKNHIARFVEEQDDALLIVSPRNRGLLAPQQLRVNWYKALKHVPRLAGMHFHDLRHTALTHWGEAGASLAQLMEVAGHADIKTVTVYQQISQQQRSQTAEKLNAQATAISKAKDNSETNSLVSVLEKLPVEQQVNILKVLDKMKQAQIISQLSADRQGELLPLLL